MRGIEIMEYLEYSKNNFLFPQEMKLFFFSRIYYELDNGTLINMFTHEDRLPKR